MRHPHPGTCRTPPSPPRENPSLAPPADSAQHTASQDLSRLSPCPHSLRKLRVAPGTCQANARARWAPSHPGLCCHHVEPPPPQRGENARSRGKGKRFALAQSWGKGKGKRLAVHAFKTHSRPSSPGSPLRTGRTLRVPPPITAATPRGPQKSQQCPARGAAARGGGGPLPALGSPSRDAPTPSRAPPHSHGEESPGTARGSVGEGESVSSRALRGHGLGTGALQGTPTGGPARPARTSPREVLCRTQGAEGRTPGGSLT